MTLKTSAFIGTTTSIDSASLSKSADLITLQNGLHQFSYPREVTFSGSKEVTLGKFWGIYDSDHAANNLFGEGVIWDSATWTRTDVVSERRMAANVACLVPDGSKVIQYTDGMIWTGYTETLSAVIKCSDYSITPFKAGDRITQTLTGGDIAIFPAVGPSAAICGEDNAATAASLVSTAIDGSAYGSPVPYIFLDIPANTTGTFDQHFIVTSLDHQESQADWHTVSLELTRFVPVENCDAASAESPLQEHLRLWLSAATPVWDTLCNDCSDFSSVPDYHSITITVSLTSGGNPSYTEAIEFFPGKKDGTLHSSLTTNYTAPV